MGLEVVLYAIEITAKNQTSQSHNRIVPLPVKFEVGGLNKPQRRFR